MLTDEITKRLNSSIEFNSCSITCCDIKSDAKGRQVKPMEHMRWRKTNRLLLASAICSAQHCRHMLACMRNAMRE